MTLKTTLKKRLLVATIVPIALLGVVLLAVSYNHIRRIMTDQIMIGLSDLAISTAAALDYTHPGDITCIGTESLVIMKGEDTLNDRFSYIDSIKEQTGLELTIFYDNIRLLTTIRDEDGERIVGTYCNSVIKEDVLKSGEAKFYNGVTISGEDYFTYYMPLKNSDGSVAGMVAVGESAQRIKQDSLDAIMPLMVFALGIILVMVVVVTGFGNRIANDIKKLNRFMGEVSKGNLQTEIEPSIARRGDEVASMGQSATKMQIEIRKLVEQDPLTGLSNRRSAARQMDKLMEAMRDHAEPFAVIICDIDFFKKVNDTYGHDAGDEVLKVISSILKSSLKGKGFVARWGGEEFLLGFSGMSAFDAKLAMQNTLDTIRATVVTVGDMNIRVTMSFGVTPGRDDLPQNAIVKAADELLYYAKTHGRNRVVILEDVELEEAAAKKAEEEAAVLEAALAEAASLESSMAGDDAQEDEIQDTAPESDAGDEAPLPDDIYIDERVTSILDSE